MDYDVIIVGGSIAGCTAAIAYGRAGLRVALIERHRSATAHKTLCGHFVLGGTHEVLRTMGLWQPMVAQGAGITRALGVWTDHGWIVPGADHGVPPAISLRRSKLDPLLRSIAASTPGVHLMLGRRVVDLVSDAEGAVAGVVVADGEARDTLRSRIVVGADGHHSPVARLADVPEDRAPNNRFLFWTYYEGARMNGPADGQVWLRGRDNAVCIRTDDGLTQVGVFPAKDRLPDFAHDRVAAFEEYVASLPDSPTLAGARRVSNLVGTTDYPCIRRDPTPRPGLALIGDAAAASDPVPAVGCGWAFRSAAWLAAATAEPLAGRGDVQRGLRAYRRAHRFIEKYDDLGRQEARALPPHPIQQAVRRAAVADPEIARRLAAFAMRAEPPSVLLDPRVLLRAIVGAGARRVFAS